MHPHGPLFTLSSFVLQLCPDVSGHQMRAHLLPLCKLKTICPWSMHGPVQTCSTLLEDNFSHIKREEMFHESMMMQPFM